MDKEILITRVCRNENATEDIRNKLIENPDHMLIAGDDIYLLIENSVFILPNDSAGEALAFAVSNKLRSPKPQCAADFYARIITDPDYIPDPSIIRKFSIRQTKPRCVAVFNSSSQLECNLSAILSSMAPAEKNDMIISIDYQTAVFIKDLDGQFDDEMKEFTEAVIGTLESEGITGISAGIGRIYPDFSGIRQSYLEGKQALSLGHRYHRMNQVFLYSQQTLERIVDAIPKDEKLKIRQDFIKDGVSNKLTDEMMETVRVFFQNDLNITAASRQLFIHRNTLNYRLDKIKKDFGLDLRCFQDAVVFRIISEICIS